MIVWVLALAAWSAEPDLLAAHAGLGSDPQFAALMAVSDHSEGARAPELLRHFLETMEAKTFSYVQGYRYEQGAEYAYWTLSDVVVPGNVSAVKSRFREVLAASGFQPQPDTDTWVLANEHLRHRIDLRGPFPHAKSEECSVSFMWRVSQRTETAPTLDQVINTFPALRDQRVEDALWAAFGATPVSVVEVGGRAKGRYEFTVTLLGPSGKPGSMAHHEQAESVFEEMGFEGGNGRWRRFKPDSYGYLSRPDPRGWTEMRIRF